MTADGTKISEVDAESTNTDVNTPISCTWCNKNSCRRLCCSFNNYCQLLSLFFAVLFFTLIGGVLFNAVERPNELRTIQESRVARNNAISDFTALLMNSTNLTEEVAVNLTVRFLELGQQAAIAAQSLTFEDNPIWDYSSAVFFASTVITTIGMACILTCVGGDKIYCGGRRGGKFNTSHTAL